MNLTELKPTPLNITNPTCLIPEAPTNQRNLPPDARSFETLLAELAAEPTSAVAEVMDEPKSGNPARENLSIPMPGPVAVEVPNEIGGLPKTDANAGWSALKTHSSTLDKLFAECEVRSVESALENVARPNRVPDGAAAIRSILNLSLEIEGERLAVLSIETDYPGR